jgi:preprotein translocase subunit SecG
MPRHQLLVIHYWVGLRVGAAGHRGFKLLRTNPHILRSTPSDQEQQATQMVYLLVVLHVIVSLFIIGVVLLQQGKSADLAGAFGGQGSQTAFGPRGAANLLTKLTTWSAVIFMCTTIGLYIALSHSSADNSVLSGTAKHAPAQTTPAKK